MAGYDYLKFTAHCLRTLKYLQIKTTQHNNTVKVSPEHTVHIHMHTDAFTPNAQTYFINTRWLK